MLAHDVEAIRIDESTLTVHALAGGNEARVALNPNCRAEQYLRRVRELLSCRALGAPGGYPVFLQRWTRMGQHRDVQLAKLLLLGEPEAIVAVAGAAGLNPELARRAWWALPNPDIARRILASESVATSPFGHQLSEYLLDHLAFETEPAIVIQTIQLVLQPGLIHADARARLWSRAVHRHHFHRLAFIEADPDSLPVSALARRLAENSQSVLEAQASSGNALARLLTIVFNSPGQAFLDVTGELLRQPVDKDTVAILLNAIGRYFETARPPSSTVGASPLAAPRLMPGGDAWALLEKAPDLKGEISAAQALALVDEATATPILATTTATGTLLRKKLGPVIGPMLGHISVLKGVPWNG